MTPITVYTTQPCARCINAKALLKKRGIEYVEINLAMDADGRRELSQRTGMTTFPQIVIGEHVLGGFDELVAAERGGQLAELMRSVG
jgi:glutaredoxin 3